MGAGAERLLEFLRSYKKENHMENTKACPKCGRDLPADEEHFYKDAKSKTGYSSWCRECQREHVARQKRKSNKADLEKKPSDAETRQESMTLVLDLSGHEDLHADIMSAADDEFRTPEMQVLWWLYTRKQEAAV